tara:strand:+ start:281 stop:1555 length:1275 start_codon:yes stop_codon:yes gene_type:complete
MENINLKICLIGLGYVGLPLAVEFAKYQKVVGFDVNQDRVDEVNSGFDRTGEVENLQEVFHQDNLKISSNVKDIINSDFYIVTVPTPVDASNTPDMSALKAASKLLSSCLEPSNFVVYESTVYPGATEDICIPILEEGSGLKLNVDFFCGYSPERINPGDREHTLDKIVKITSGSNSYAANIIANVYNMITNAGVHRAPSIKVAEAAKVIENTQRDLNIALMNELSMLFQELNINTNDVLQAAETKWNFLRFRPGLVGGHCIGVDPYYLTHKAKEVGFHPQLILAGRRTNDLMASYISSEILKKAWSISGKCDRVLLVGFTFKENCPDCRNTKCFDLYSNLTEVGLKVDVYDPVVDVAAAKNDYGIDIVTEENLYDEYSIIVFAVPHGQIKQKGYEFFVNKLMENGLLFDLKSTFPDDNVTFRM